jgi:DtxR family Mn-dependent transcriptional regulator
MSNTLTKPERETLKAVWRLSRAPGSDGFARNGDLAGSLRVSPATATATVKRLAERGLLSHTPYHGVVLSAEGERRAMQVIRRHRIVERFLADQLGYTWAEADALAPVFEHQLPQEVEDRLFVALGRPESCPHGFPIPGEGGASLPRLPVLYDLGLGERAVVALPGSTAPELASFLDGLGVRPGTEVAVLDRQPFDGPLVVRVQGRDTTLGASVAKQIFVSHVTVAGEDPAGHRAPAEGAVEAPAETDPPGPATTRGGGVPIDRGRLPRGEREKRTR